MKSREGLFRAAPVKNFPPFGPRIDGKLVPLVPKLHSQPSHRNKIRDKIGGKERPLERN
jgi:hypothetical protein